MCAIAACPKGDFCPFGSQLGIKCSTYVAPFTTTASTQAISWEECLCRQGMYLQTTVTETIAADGNITLNYDSECVTCPVPGTNCTEDGVTLEQLPVLPDFWRSGVTSSEMRMCFTKDACLGGTNMSELCRNGHSGPFCDVCLPGYHKGSMGLCIVCSGAWGPTLGVLVGGIVVLILGIVITMRLKEAKKMSEKAKDQVEKQLEVKQRVDGPTMRNVSVAAQLALPAMALPELVNVLKLKFPNLNWPTAPDISLGSLQLPDASLPDMPIISLPNISPPEFAAKYPHLVWPDGPGLSLPHLFNFLKISCALTPCHIWLSLSITA